MPQKGGYTDRFYEMIGMDRSVLEYQRWRGPSTDLAGAMDHRNSIREADRAVKQLLGA